MVGINSRQMRAIRYCLMQPGLNPAKIAILCGGPDWPTSVLCGILGVPLRESMIGTYCMHFPNPSDCLPIQN